MGIVYRILGLTAAIGQRLSRMRVNFVPLNWALMAVLGILFAAAVGSATEGFSNGTKPKSVLLSDIVERRANLSRNYVQVSGTLFPDDAITSTRRSKYESEEQATKKAPSKAWVPLVAKDASGNLGAILVQLENATATGGPPREATITGLLKPMDSKVAQKLTEDSPTDSRLKIDTQYVLVENDKPGSGWTWTLIALGSGTALAALATTFAMKYVVFQKQEVVMLPLPGPVSAATFDAPDTITRATGLFAFGERNLAQRFLNVPAWLTQTEQGEAVLVANVDASSRLFGFTTDKRNGLWAILLGQMAGHPAEKGTLYLGASALPSLRIKTIASPENGPSRTVILSSNNEAEREQLIQALITPHTPRASDVAPPPPNAVTPGASAPLPFDL